MSPEVIKPPAQPLIAISPLSLTLPTQELLRYHTHHSSHPIPGTYSHPKLTISKLPKIPSHSHSSTSTSTVEISLLPLARHDIPTQCVELTLPEPPFFLTPISPIITYPWNIHFLPLSPPQSFYSVDQYEKPKIKPNSPLNMIEPNSTLTDVFLLTIVCHVSCLYVPLGSPIKMVSTQAGITTRIDLMKYY